MNEILQQINSAGKAFVEFAGPMLIQSSVLILILLLADLLLRRKVRAVFRYWMWMLVLVKLVLPTSLSLPMSFGYWFGDNLRLVKPHQRGEAEHTTQIPQASPMPTPTQATPSERIGAGPTEPAPMPTPEPAPAEPIPAEPVSSPAVSPTVLSWQGAAFLVWLAVVAAMCLLLLQRAVFVRGLIAQAEESPSLIKDMLQDCCEQMSVRRKIGLKVSPNAVSPAVCGLFRPVILVPQNLASSLGSNRLRVVLMHELAHIRRADLWFNLAQTFLQLVYFYNPLLWLANAIIRRVREQAVDEMMLVAMGENAQQYPQTLLDVAKLAFRQPALSLRLIGVVESKSALASRIKHIINRPIPKTAKLGVLSLAAILVIAVILLPMARAVEELEFKVEGGPLDIRLLAVVPDGSGIMYDGQGKKLDTKLGPIDVWESLWGSDKQQRDFIFELPNTDTQILLDPYRYVVCPAGTDRRLSWSSSCTFGQSDGHRLFMLAAELPRSYRKGTVLLFTRDAPVRKIDLRLRYYYGPRQQAICSFTGPFKVGKKTLADGDLPYEIIPAKIEFPDDTSSARFRFSTKQKLDSDIRFLIYDTSGRRYLVTTVGRMTGTDDARLVLESDYVPLEQIAAITVGEKSHERTFRNVVVHYADRPARDYPEYLDQMAGRLGLTHLPKEELGRYKFKDANEAISVIDIICGRGLTYQAMQTLMSGKPTIDIRSLDEQVQNKIRQTANAWLNTADLRIRARGIQLGLLGTWSEFFEPALQMLSTEYPLLMPDDLRLLRHELGYIVWMLLNKYPEQLSTEQLQQLKRSRDGHHGLPILSSSDKPAPAIGPQETPNAKSDQSFSATLPNGVTVELIGLCEHPSEGKQWWGSDGQSIAKPYERLNYTESSRDYKRYEMAYRVFGSDDIASTIYSNAAVIGYAGPYPLSQRAKDLNTQDADNAYGAILFVKPDAQSILLEIGVGRNSDWRTLCTQGSPVDKTGTAGTGVVFQPAIEKDGKTYVTIAHQTKDKQIQVVTIDHSGQLHKPEGISNTTSNELGSCQVCFDLPADQIKEIQFQTQKFQRVTFKNVSLQPDVKTDVQIEVEKAAVQVEVLTDKPAAVLDLDSGKLMRIDKNWPDEYDVAWDNDKGGSLFAKPDGPVKMLPIVEPKNFADALLIAAQKIESLKQRGVRGVPGQQSKYILVKTSQENTAVVEVQEFDENKAKIRWQIIQQPIAKTDVQVQIDEEQTGVSSSRAWYIMRQWHARPLLLGLTQRLGKVIKSAQPDDPVWTGVTNGGRLKLDIAVEGDVTGEIFVGFFKDAAWSAEPVQVRRLSAAGKHIVDNLPPGKFQIGAMIGRLPVAAALGVQRTWPEPVEIIAGVISTADVLLSPEFEEYARGWYNSEFSRDFIGDWQDMDADNLLQGRVTGPGGRPIAFAKIEIREYNPGARGIAAPNRGTNEQGYYKYDGMRWPYWVSVSWTESLPWLFGYRYQHSSFNRVLEGPQKINFQFDSFPTGTATLTGKVADQNGNPIREFLLHLETRFDWEDRLKNPDGKYYNVVGYGIPFISQDGVFRLSDLPSGVFSVGVTPFNSLVYEFGRRQEAKLEAGETTNVNVEVTAKDIFYGRVLFSDGSPAVVKPAPRPRANIWLVMPVPGEEIAAGVISHSVADVEDDGYFAVHLSEAEIEQLKSGRSKLVINVRTAQDGPRKYMGEFPFALLARDKSKAGVLNIGHPPGERQSPVDKPLPKFEGIEIEFNAEQAVIGAIDNKATLASGATVELLGLSYIPVTEDLWWRADGSPLPQAPFDDVSFTPSVDPNWQQFAYYTIAIQITGKPPQDVGLLKWDFTNAVYAGTTSAYAGARRVYYENIHAAATEFPKAVQRTTLRLGIFSGGWQTIFAGRHYGFYQKGKDTAHVRTPERVGGPGSVGPDEKGLHIEVTYNVTDRDFRVVAVDNDGKVHLSSRSGSGGTQNLRRTTASFPNLTHDQLQEFRFQVRPYEWAEFKNVSLRPGTEAIALAEQRKAAKQKELERWLGQSKEREIREQILILRQSRLDHINEPCVEQTETISAMRKLTEIGQAAVPELTAELQLAEHGLEKSLIAFILRALGDERAVPALIDALGKSNYRGEYGIYVKDDALAEFMLDHQHREPDESDRQAHAIIIACPVIEITKALEKITGHSEGPDRFSPEAAEIIKQRWQKWWDRNQ